MALYQAICNAKEGSSTPPSKYQQPGPFANTRHARTHIFSLPFPFSFSPPSFLPRADGVVLRTWSQQPRPDRLERPVNINAILIGNTIGDAGGSMNKLEANKPKSNGRA